MPGKRQHYVPLLMLRRFAVDPGDKRSLIYRLDKKSGQPRRVNPRNEAVVGRYYRMVDMDGEVNDEVDALLDAIEGEAARVIAGLERDPTYLALNDRPVLALFVQTLKTRTPEGRSQLNELDRLTARLWTEMRLSDPETNAVLRDDGETEEEVDRRRLKYLKQIQDGSLELRSTPDREVSLMFLAADKAVEAMLSRLSWTLLRAPEGRPFILSDHPVAHFDPEPMSFESGASYLTSPGSVTTVPLDPGLALRLAANDRYDWDTREASIDEVDWINLLTYAWAGEAVYGPNQESVARVRRLARRKKALMARLAKRPGRVWLTETESGEAFKTGPKVFKSTHKGEAATRTFYYDGPTRRSA
jgi:hypothetical protein